jgi:hypothetical protein
MDPKNIITFIDDKSRKIIFHWFVTEKKAVSTSIALENALQKANNPDFIFYVFVD